MINSFLSLLKYVSLYYAPCYFDLFQPSDSRTKKQRQLRFPSFHIILLLLYLFNILVSAIKQSKTTNVTILNPVVHLLGDDAASIGYIKVTQTLDK